MPTESGHKLAWTDPHERGQRRSLALHAAALDMLEAKPSLFSEVMDNLERQRRNHPEAAVYFDRWSGILAQGVRAMRDAVLDPGAHGRVLRSSSPLAGILDQNLRRRILQATP